MEPTTPTIESLPSIHFPRAVFGSVVMLIIATANTPRALSQAPARNAEWLRVTEDELGIKIETDKLEAVIPKKKNKHWMTGIEKHSFLDKTTGFREIGDGLMVVDWLMEAGSDEAYADQILHTQSTPAIGRYLWHANETDPAAKARAIALHGSSHRKRMVEGPQLCPWMKPVQPEVIRGRDFVAVKTTYRFEFAAPGRKAGSQWTQLIVFPRGERFFVLMDKIDSVNDSDEMFLRNDTPGSVRHEKGDTFSEMYLSYLSGPNGVRIPSSEFFTPFPPDRKFNYRRDVNKTPEHFIRAYHLRDKQTGKNGPWLAGMTLEPSVVYEAWCAQWPGDFLVMIEEIHGRPVKAGGSFSAAHIVGYFDTIEEMHKVYDRYKGHTALTAASSGWRLLKNPKIREKAVQILHRALDVGVNYFDTCCGYGASESIIGEVAATRRKEMFVATKCFRCNVPGDQLRRELEQSLKLLRTDQIDLWQIHNLSNLRHVEMIFEKGRAIDVFLKAKQEGLTRFIGITTHSSRQVIKETLMRCEFAGIEMDTVLLAFNAFDQSGGGNGKRVLAEHPAVGKIAMKTLAGDGAPIVRRGALSVETALRYVLSHDVATAIVGTHSLEKLEQNVKAVREFQPCTPKEIQEIEQCAAETGKPLRVLTT